jgi:hypothetical protein
MVVDIIEADELMGKRNSLRRNYLHVRRGWMKDVIILGRSLASVGSACKL